MRGRLVAIMMLLVAGCVAPEAVDTASSEPDLADPPTLLEAPRVLSLPAGSSYAIVRLDATQDDWVESEVFEGKELRFGYEFPEVDVEARAILLYRIEEEGSLDHRSGSYGSGTGARGSTAFGGDPEDRSYLMVIALHNASEAFELRVGARASSDDDLTGAAIPANVLATGMDLGFASYLEIGSPFSRPELVTIGVEVEDTRVLMPPEDRIAGAAGSLSLKFDHGTNGSALHNVWLWAFSFSGARVGSWTAASSIDDETVSAGSLFADPATDVSLHRWGTAHASASTSVTLDDFAFVTPGTLLHAVTIPFDLSAHGMSHENGASAREPIPVSWQTPQGCLVVQGGVMAEAPSCDLRAE